MKDYHDVEIIGFHYNKNLNTLTINFDNMSDLNISNVVYFEFSDFSLQNIILDIEFYINKNIPEYLTVEFPSLNFYKTSEDAYNIFYIEASVGAFGVIVQSEE